MPPFSRPRVADRLRQGFTIIELLIALAVIAIISALAFPTVSAAMADSRLRDGVNELRFFLAEARARATERNLAVVVRVTPAPGGPIGGAFGLWESTSRDCSGPDTSTAPLLGYRPPGGGPVREFDLSEFPERFRNVALTDVGQCGASLGGAIELCIRPDGGVYERPGLNAIAGPIEFRFRRYEDGSPAGVERVLRLNFNGIPRIER